MREGVPSRTAAMVAAARTLGALLPARVQLADDPYGLGFVGGALPRGPAAAAAAWAVRLPVIRPWVMYMQVRTRLLDDVVRGFARAGGRQLVLL
ncbi:MAG: class I SAM-dependent methyltransferase, partial [Myxococcales bacterium]|nr:class I SAM-dependent methyltransferase [Myxococcales bacterium]